MKLLFSTLRGKQTPCQTPVDRTLNFGMTIQSLQTYVPTGGGRTTITMWVNGGMKASVDCMITLHLLQVRIIGSLLADGNVMTIN